MGKQENDASLGDNYGLHDGPPEEKIKTWLEMSKNDAGHYKAGDWMASLLPNLGFVSASSAWPHPSVNFSFTVQEDQCNRLQNLHGGCAASLFDFCTTLPLALVNKPGFWQYLGVSRTLNVTYFRPVPAGTEVLIETEIVQVGKKLATLKGVMKRRRDGAIMAICEHGKANIDPEQPKL